MAKEGSKHDKEEWTSVLIRVGCDICRSSAISEVIFAVWCYA